MIRVYYSPAYVGSGYAFDTTRKARWIADSLVESPIPDIELAVPQALTREQDVAVHAPRYVRAIETGLDIVMLRGWERRHHPGGSGCSRARRIRVVQSPQRPDRVRTGGRLLWC